MRSTAPSLGGAAPAPPRAPAPGAREAAGHGGFSEPIPSGLVLVNLLIAAGVVLFPIPALVLGARGLLKRPGYSADEPADRASYIVLVDAAGAAAPAGVRAVRGDPGVDDRRDRPGRELHGLVYVFFALDVLLALLIVFSFGRRDRRPVRRRATPAAR